MNTTIVRIFGNAVVEAPNYRALVRAENWHRRRLAALREQCDRTAVFQNPARSCELHEQIEQHEAAIRDIRAGKTVIETAARAIPAPVARSAERSIHNDAVMSTDWRKALAAVEEVFGHA